MNRRELMVGAGAAGLAAAILQVSWAGTNGPETSAEGPRQTRLLDRAWRFHEGDITPSVLITHDDTYGAAKAGAARGAASPKFDDSAWEKVKVPHDFASFQPIADGNNVDQGYRRRGIAWYRNTLRFDESDRGKHIELQIEGAATQATVWFNGTLVARILSGYVSTYIDITPYATFGDTLNHLAIRVDATQMEGWWYEGAGLYRDVKVMVRNPVHIVTDGVFAQPVKGADGKWTIPVEVTLYNSGNLELSVWVQTILTDGGARMDEQRVEVRVPPLQSVVAHLESRVTSPKLWSVDSPHLYEFEVELLLLDQIVKGHEDKPHVAMALDYVQTFVGFRTTRWDAKTGFFLNDKPLKIKGICLHQDHAGVGTAIPVSLMRWRLERLKTLGCNAIRFSHNAQSRDLMDLCDELGFLVMAENRNFNPSEDYMRQLEWLVRRDRNHPSVYLWSVFNEEPMQGTPQGYEMVRRMSAVVKSLDTTRPVTAAMNGGLDTPLNVSHAVDVVGINYQQELYDVFHTRYPDKPVYSSEDTSAWMTRGAYKTDAGTHIMASYDDDAAPWGETHRAAWKAIVERPYVAGTFVWTGFDYHGEPTPHTFPTNSSFFGILDLCGFDKAAAHIHRAQWIDDKPVLGLVPHWNWQKSEKVRVMACTNADEVELFVNGKSAGRQKGDRLQMNFWTVDYAPGFIEARAYKAGKVVATARNETTGPAVALKLVSDRTSLTADGRDALPVAVMAVDAKGRVVPGAAHKVTFGGTAPIIGLGNGDPNCLEPEKGNLRSLFDGLAQVIVQAPDVAGNGAVTLTIAAEGVKAASINIALEPPRSLLSHQATA